MVVLAILFAPSNDAAAVYFIFGSCTIAWVQTIGNPYRNVGIYSAVVAIICCALHLSLFSTIYAVGLSALLGVVTARNIERQSTNAALRIAHAEVERMAKVAERERIARDLHDVLGHTLSVIVLKSELAAKLADRDIERAASEIREIEQIARTSLSELREAIAGYRSAGIESELVRARSVLELAGVTVSCRNEPLALTPTQEGVLALAIREGVTNIIRHARASSCRLQLSHGQGTVCLEIADDGRGGSGREGSGLLGMRERVEQLGGSLARDVANGTRLIVTLPT
jgi:two-component system sensor histidine kinase DesK